MMMMMTNDDDADDDEDDDFFIYAVVTTTSSSTWCDSCLSHDTIFHFLFKVMTLACLLPLPLVVFPLHNLLIFFYVINKMKYEMVEHFRDNT